MIARSNHSGFTAVELLVTLIVAFIFIITFYQLYSVAVTDSGDARYRAEASNFAYSTLRDSSNKITRPCSIVNPTAPTIPANTLPTPTAIAVAIDCPYGTTSDVSRITVTITYGSPSQEVVHVLFKS